MMSNSESRKRQAELAPTPDRVRLTDEEMLTEVVARRLSWASLHWFPSRSRKGIRTPTIAPEIAPEIAKAVLASGWLTARETALRAQIAADIEAVPLDRSWNTAAQAGAATALTVAARIARGAS